MPSLIMKAARVAAFLSLLYSLRGASAQGVHPNGAEAAGRPSAFWGGDTDDIEQWQELLGDPDATGSFTLPGFNISQPWAGAEKMDWNIKIAIKTDMPSPRNDGARDAKVVTGGMVWIEPPEDLVQGAKGNYTANEEWSPLALYYTSRAFNEPDPDPLVTPFFHADPGAEAPADGSCSGILPDECIEFLTSSLESDRMNKANIQSSYDHREACPGLGISKYSSLDGPLSLAERGQDGAAMRYDGGWLLSFNSAEHEKGSETDYAAHGSQYIPVIFQWLRTREKGKEDEERPNGELSTLLCVAVNKAAEGKKLPKPDKEYLEAVEEIEAGRLYVSVFS